jgi:hypothetical protein
MPPKPTRKTMNLQKIRAIHGSFQLKSFLALPVLNQQSAPVRAGI